MVKIVTRYDYAAQAEKAPGTDNKEESMTNQADLKMSDINVIMRNAQRGQTVPLAVREPIFGDFSGVTDYHDMLSRVREVERSFYTLSAEDRNRFDNDPQKLIDFLADEKNDEEAVKLGFKDASVLLTELDVDGVSKVTKADRAFLDKMSPAEKEARIKMLAEAKAKPQPPAA